MALIPALAEVLVSGRTDQLGNQSALTSSRPPAHGIDISRSPNSIGEPDHIMSRAFGHRVSVPSSTARRTLSSTATTNFAVRAHLRHRRTGPAASRAPRSRGPPAERVHGNAASHAPESVWSHHIGDTCVTNSCLRESQTYTAARPLLPRNHRYTKKFGFHRRNALTSGQCHTRSRGDVVGKRARPRRGAQTSR